MCLEILATLDCILLLTLPSLYKHKFWLRKCLLYTRNCILVWENSSLMLKGQDYVLLDLFYVQVLECSMQYCVHNVLELDRVILG